MAAKLLAGGFLLLELLALALLAGSGGSAVWADPAYNNHQLRAKCEAEATDCGSVCFYANCAECDQCCTCWETCEREQCRTYRRCRWYTEPDGSRYRDCERRERCWTVEYNCRYHTRKHSVQGCNGTGSVDCHPRSAWWDCAECQRWEWLLYEGPSVAGDKDGDRDFEVVSQSLEQAVNLILQPVASTVECDEAGATAPVTPIPTPWGTGVATYAPTVPVVSTPASPGAAANWPAGHSLNLRVFPRDSLGTYRNGPSLVVTRKSDNEVDLRIGASVRELRKQPERCLDPDPEGGACRRWETELSRTGEVPPGYRLRYRYYSYHGLVRPAVEYGPWHPVPAAGRVSVVVPRPGFWTFEAVQEKMDGSEPARSAARALALGYAAFINQAKNSGMINSPDGTAISKPVGGQPTSGLAVPPTATPLPALAGGLARPGKPALSGAAQDFDAVGRVKLTLGSAAAAGDTVEFRYWPHNGFLPDGDPRWAWRAVAHWDTANPRRAFFATDTARWNRQDAGGRHLAGFWSFQVRLGRMVGGELVYGEPSNVITAVVRGFKPAPP